MAKTSSIERNKKRIRLVEKHAAKRAELKAILANPGADWVPRVRIFLDWVMQLFADVEHQRQLPLPATPMPRWASVAPTSRARAI